MSNSQDDGKETPPDESQHQDTSETTPADAESTVSEEESGHNVTESAEADAPPQNPEFDDELPEEEELTPDLVEEEALPEELREDDVKVSAEEYADYLWQVYREKDFPKPRNFIGMTKKLPESEMEKLIYANTEVDEEVLGKLARERALAVQKFHSEEGQMPKERIFLKEPEITAAPDKETTTRARVELGASVQ